MDVKWPFWQEYFRNKVYNRKATASRSRNEVCEPTGHRYQQYFDRNSNNFQRLRYAEKQYGLPRLFYSFTRDFTVESYINKN